MTPPRIRREQSAADARLAENGRIGRSEKEYFRADGSRSVMLCVGASLGGSRVVDYGIDLAGHKHGEDPPRVS